MKTAGSPDEEKDARNLEQVPTVEADDNRGKLERLREKAEEVVGKALTAFEAGGKAAAAESVFGSEENKDILTVFRRECQGPWAVMCANLQGVVDLNELRRFTRVDKHLRLASEDDSLSYVPSVLGNEFGYFVQRMTLEGPVPEQVTNFKIKVLRRIELPDGEEVLDAEVTKYETQATDEEPLPDQ